MHQRSVRIVAVIAVAMVITLAGAHRASADGAVLIDSCQTLTDNNTTYKLTTNLTSCGDCLVVGVSKITIDLQGHSIISTCPGEGAAITDQQNPFDLIVVKNGSVSGYEWGVQLLFSTRVSVLGVTAKDNLSIGILTGPQGLVKSSEAAGSSDAGIVVQDRGQVQQCNVHDNNSGIVSLGNNCLITMNTANANGFGILTLGNKCTVSYNTASDNAHAGIANLVGTSHLVTHNVALNNGSRFDYSINCPSDVTNNDSTNGFPTSYFIAGTGCHFVNNN